MMDNKGQVSLEYLLIFSLSLIVLIAFTLPLLHDSLDDVFDVSDSIKTKSDLSKIANAIKQVYGEGQGSKHTVVLDIDKPVNINVADDYVSAKIKLKSNQNKQVKINVKSNLKTNSFKLSKGEKAFIIEWPVGSEYMTIYQK